MRSAAWGSMRSLAIVLLFLTYVGTPLFAEEDKLSLPADIQMIFVPPGKFLMGSPKGEKGRGRDEDQVAVEITRQFYWFFSNLCGLRGRGHHSGTARECEMSRT